MPENRIPIIDGPWVRGIDSLSDPMYAPQATVQWSVNTLNRGGIYQTRPGFSVLWDTVPSHNQMEPRGLAVFKPKDDDPWLVKAVGTVIKISKYPFTSWYVLDGVTMDDGLGPVHMEQCVYGSRTNDDGSLTIVNPYPVLMISNGETATAVWDGITARHLDPLNNETPIGTWMKWIGNRLWIANGPTLKASNLLEPTKFTEINLVAGGGVLNFPDDITGLGGTANLQSLLVFTDSTTSAVQAQILAREDWGSIPNFQQVLLQQIGCVAGRSVVNQYGMTWWYSQGGLINLDEALIAYRSSKLHYKDELMARSKTNLSSDISGICCGAFGNFLMVSVPSGDVYNAHTWVMDQSVIDAPDGSSLSGWSSCWTGPRPVQWVTSTIKGQTRVFCISSDINGEAPLHPNSDVWEAFCGSRRDFTMNTNGADTATSQPIPCSVETRYLSDGANYKTFDHIEALVSEVKEGLDFEMDYASRHSGYITVLDKHIEATVDSVASSMDDITNDAVDRFKQRRRLVSFTNEADANAGVEDNEHTQNVDKGFFVLHQWQGECALENMILFVNPVTDSPRGKIEPEELTERWIDADGNSEITDTVPDDGVYRGIKTSSPVGVSTVRSQELDYRLLVYE